MWRTASVRGRLDAPRIGGAQNSGSAPPGKQKLTRSRAGDRMRADQSSFGAIRARRAARSEKGSGSSPTVTGSKATPGLRG